MSKIGDGRNHWPIHTLKSSNGNKRSPWVSALEAFYILLWVPHVTVQTTGLLCHVSYIYRTFDYYPLKVLQLLVFDFQ